MKYGKLFKKFNAKYNTTNWSSNKVSGLSFKELQTMARLMKNDGNTKIVRYIAISKDKLAHDVYAALKTL